MLETQPVYLCQIREGLSCGACCGLYNVADPSREYLSSELFLRTLEFAKIPRTEDAIDAFSIKTLARQDVFRRPYKEFYHCPFLGLVGESRDRPGCLLHPLGAGNEGLDLRGLSWYGAMACRTYFCPSHGKLAGRYSELVKACCDDWHVYGLVITETEMLSCFFSEVEKIMGAELDPGKACGNKLVRQAVADFIFLKLSWPFRRPLENRLGNYFFNDNLNPRPQIPYRELSSPESALDPIFKGLCSFFPDRESLEDATELIVSSITNLARAVSCDTIAPCKSG